MSRIAQASCRLGAGLGIVIALVFPLACALPPGTFTVTFEWAQGKPDFTSPVYIFGRVEQRPGDPTKPGTVLKTAGPVQALHGTVDLPLNGVPNGDNLVVIVEIRAAASDTSQLLYDGTSASFSLHPGDKKVVPVLLNLEPAPTATTQLSFVSQPSTIVAGATMSPAVRVALMDAFGQTVVAASGSVTLALADNGNGAALNGTLTALVTNGIATFADLTVQTVGTGLVLQATSASLPVAMSTAFNVTPAAATSLKFSSQPSSAVAGATLTPAVAVSLLDAFGNVATDANNTVTLALGSGPEQATLNGTLTQPAISGVATFADLSLAVAGSGYTILATSGTLPGGTSASFDVTAGAAASLDFSSQPTNTVAGSVIAPGVAVSVLDSFGNTVTSSSAGITLSLATNPTSATLGGTLTQTAVNGIAVFNDLSIQTAGVGYTLRAASGSLSAPGSSPFNVTPAASGQLAFGVQPTNVVAGLAMAPSVTVAIEDSFGNVITNSAANVTIQLATNPTGTTLYGTATQPAVNGVATFDNLSLRAAGTGYTFNAISGSFVSPASQPFQVSSGAATELVFGVQPLNVQAGTDITPAVTVVVEDSFGNTVPSSASITVNLATNPTSTTLRGTLTQSSVQGVATFADLSLTSAATGYALGATSGSLTALPSSSFNVTPAEGTQLAFVIQPSDAVAGVAIAPAVSVAVEDTFGNIVSSSSASITLNLATNPTSTTLLGTVTQAAVNGVATFPDLNIRALGSNYSIGATSGALTAAPSNSFNILPAAVDHLAFVVQPSNVVAGVTIAPAVTVVMKDVYGNTVTSSTVRVTLSLATNPTGASLLGTLTKSAINGIATFTDLAVDTVGTAYALGAASGSLAAPMSGSFNVTPAAATQLAFGAAPTTTVAGMAIAPAVTVAIEDSFGNTVTSSSATVTVSLATNPTTATLLGTLSQAAVNGVATFNDLSIQTAGTGYTLGAASGSLSGTISTAFNVTSAAAFQLAFTGQPSTVVAGVSIAPAVIVALEDSFGNIVTSPSASVTLSLTTNPTSAPLLGTVTQPAVNGVATFNDLNIHLAGVGYALGATNGTFTSPSSNPFNVAPAAATQLSWGVQPSNATASEAITPAVSVVLQDAFGNTEINSSANITVNLATSPTGALLLGTTTQPAVNGVATFNDLNIQTAGTGYALGATSGSFTAPTSSTFNVAASAATHLAFVVQPTNVVAGAAIAPTVTVEFLDTFGNPVTTASANITLSLATNPTGTSLFGTTTQPAVNGVATFTDLNLHAIGTGYALGAASGSLTATPSSTFNVTAAAAQQLAFGVQPTSVVAGVAMAPSVTVGVEDAFGNPVTSSSASITLSLATNPTATTLGGTTTQQAVGGVATFSDLSITTSGSGYVLGSASGSLTSTLSSAFNVSPAPPAQLAFNVEPTSAHAGVAIAPAVTVAIEDSFGNTVTTSSASVTLALTTNPGSATLLGTTTRTALNGVASFNDLNIRTVGMGYVLGATSGSLTSATSSSFDVTPAAASQLAFGVQPSNTVAGVAIAPAVTVAVEDSFGNIVSSSPASVTVRFALNPTATTLRGTTTQPAISGVATFADLNIQTAGSGYALSATIGSLTSPTSSTFDVTPAAASQLAFGVQPSNVVAGVSIAPAVVVAVEDPFGNVATSFSASVTVSLATNPGATALLGTTTQAAVNGRAAFADLNIEAAANGYALGATAGSLSSPSSNVFNVTPAAPAQLAFLVEPSTTVAGTTLAPPPQVAVEDVFGNLTPSALVNVTLTLANAPGASLVGTVTQVSANGVAQFPDLSINTAGSGYLLDAASSGLKPTVSSAFDITPAAPSSLVFGTGPSNVIAGVAIAPAVTVVVEDSFGNTVTASSAIILVSLSSNPTATILLGTTSQAAVAGVATFPDLNIRTAGTGYALGAASGSLTAAPSNTFNVTAATAAKLAFGTQPSNEVAGVVMAPAVTVAVQDSFGNTVTTSTANVTLSLAPNPTGTTLLGTTAQAAVGGIATFGDLDIYAAASGYGLSAGSGPLTSASSQVFNVTPAAATQLAFDVQPSNTAAGVTIAPSVSVVVEDSFGNQVTSSTAAITVSLVTNPTGTPLLGTVTKNASSGVALFNDLGIQTAGTGYALGATSGSLTSPPSDAFNVTPAAASLLAFEVQPSSTVAGVTISPAVTVAVEDAFGNLVTTSAASISVGLATNPTGASLLGTTTRTASAGIAVFDDLSSQVVGTGFTLGASSGSLTLATSNPFNITPASATQLAFGVQPSTVVAGVAIAPAVTVAVQDSFGNTMTGSSASITLSLATNPTSTTLNGTLTRSAMNGVATFNDLNIETAGAGYELGAASASLASAVSSSFNVTPAAATKLAFSVQPTTVVAGVALAPAVTVAVQDSYGNTVTASTASITVSLATDPTAATLLGTTSRAGVNGVATFGDLNIQTTGTGYFLGAASPSLTSATSNPFNVTPAAATKLVFGVQPSNVVAGVAIAPAVTVVIQDSFGNTVTSSSASVALSLATNPASATLLGTTPRTAVNGIATFADVSIQTTGTGYALGAASASLTSATSSAFNVTPAAAAKLAFGVQPTNVVAGAAIAPAMTVAIQDSFGNTVTGSTANVTVGLATDPTSTTLLGTTTRAAVGGVATFNDLNIDSVGTGYTLGGTSGSLTAANSNSFNVSPAAAAKLVFGVQPSSTTAGVIIAPAVTVTVEDSFGNTVTSSSASITAGLVTNPTSATLLGTLTHTASSGVATFNDLSLQVAGTGYALGATSVSLLAATSNAFTVTPAAAAKLAFGVQPSNVVAGVAIVPAVTVAVEDSFGNTVTSSSANIAMNLATNPTTATLLGTTTRVAVGGVATFNDLNLQTTGTGYALGASTAAITAATSSTFNVTPAAPAKLAFSVQPSNGVAGMAIAPAMTVAVEDSFGNTVTTSSANVTLSLTTDPTSATLLGALTQSAVSGVATFNDLNIQLVGTGYQLGAASPSLISATSTPFNITPAAAVKLAFGAQPTTTIAGVAIAPSVTVLVEDAFGNTVTTSTASVTASLATDPTSATLLGTTTRAAVSGVATFNDLNIQTVGTGYALGAEGGSLTGATSSTFNVTPAAATKLAFGVQPSTVVAGVAIAPAVTVAIEDSFGNTVTSSSANVAVSLATNPTSASLFGTVTRAAVGGVATFSDLSLQTTGVAYALGAASASLTSATSNPFNVTPAAAARLAFGVQPSDAVAGVVIAPSVSVLVEDSFGNTVTTSPANIALNLSTDPTAAPLLGTTTRAAVGGVATFNDLNIRVSGSGYALGAASGSLTSATSSAFNVTPAAATKLAFGVQPSNVVAGVAIAPAVTVAIEDSFGNTVTSSSASVALSLATNPTSATLFGTTPRAAVNGIATFSDLSIRTVGTAYALGATSASLTSATSNPFNVTPASAARLAFGVEPSSVVAGAAIAPAVTVLVQDAFGNTVTSSTASVTTNLATDPTSAPLLGTTTRAAVSGVATFNDLNIQTAGTGYALGTSSGSLTSAVSSSFNVTPAAATKVAFGVQPSNVVAGVVIAPSVTVAIEDPFGNTVTSSSANITLSLPTDPTGATLLGTTTRAAVNGLASFNDLSIDVAANGYALGAACGALTPATSSTFNVTPAASSQLAFAVEPSNTVAGVTMSPTVQVAVEDAFGNVTPGALVNITLALTNAPGAVLAGTTTQASIAGVAQFADLSIDVAGLGYGLTATSTALTNGVSTTFNITPAAATGLAFKAQPSNVVAGVAIAPSVTVAVEDAFGNTVTTSSANVTVSLATNPTSTVLFGTTTQAASNGVARFPDLNLHLAGAGYALGATSGTFTAPNSGAFNVSAAAAAQLAFGVEPSNVPAAVVINPAVTLLIEDPFGNTVTTSSANVTVSLVTDPTSASLFGTTTHAAVNGVATFNDLNIRTAGTGYALGATSGSFISAASTLFNVTPSVVSQLVFVTPPSSVAAGAAMAPSVMVAFEDASGNIVLSSTASVTLSLATNPTSTTLFGTLTQAALNGVATFNDLSIDAVGTGYALGAASMSLPLATSSSFNVTPGAAAKVVFGVQPSTVVAGVAISPAVSAVVEDAYGNTVTASSANITLSLSTNPTGTTLLGTLTQAAVGGFATFSNLSLDAVGTGYVLGAASGAFSTAISNPFNVTPAAAAKLAFGVQPTTVVAGVSIAPSVTVQVEDAFGNPVTTSTASITASLATNPTSATLHGTLTRAAVGGVATFDDLNIQTVGTGYALGAAGTSLASTTSNTFNVTPAAAAKLAFGVQPSNVVAGVAIAPAVTVLVEDSFGNTVTTSTASVTASLTTDPTSAALLGTTTQTAVNGVATFSALNIQTVGTGYVLGAASGSLSAGTSNPFNVTPAASAKLAFGLQPSTTVAGVAIAPAVSVVAEDSFGNTVTTSSANITLSLSTNPTGTTLLGTLTQAAVGGIATFSSLTLDAVGTGYVLGAASGALSTATSNPFNVTPAAAAKLAFGVQPSAVVAGVSIAPAVTVQVEDAFGNLVTTSTASVIASLATNPTSTTLYGTLTQAAVGGVATFNDLSVQTVRTGYALGAASTSLTSATSSSFNVTPAAASMLAFGVQPSTTVAGVAIAPAVTVLVEDSFGNTVTTSTASVTASLTTDPTSAALLGTATQTAVNGVATFGNLNIQTVGTGYVLGAASGSLSAATSNPFNITPASSAKLAFGLQPSNAVAGVAIAPAVSVLVEDSFGNTVTSSSASVTVDLATDPTSAALFGTATRTAVNGIATFNDLNVEVAANGYALGATSGSLTGATSGTFNITPAASMQLAFAVEPSTTVAGVTMSPTVQVAVEDSFGNLTPSTLVNITLALTNAPGAALAGTTTAASISGVAQFSNLSIDTAGLGYGLDATSSGLTTAVSIAFNVTPAGAAKLAFEMQPSNVVAGVAIAPAVTVAVEDSFGNTVTTSSASVTMSLSSDPTSATLLGTTTQSAFDGVAAFTDLNIHVTGTGYVLGAASGSLTATVSDAFNVTPAAATKLAFGVQPSAVVAGVAIAPAVTALVEDAFGNTVTTSTASVTVNLATDPTSATLLGTATRTAAAGVATFNDLNIQTVGTGYALGAASGSLTAAVSTTFNVTPAGAGKLAFGVQPSNAVAGVAIAPSTTVLVEDVFGNTVTTSTASVTASLATDPTSATLLGTVTRTAVNGVATFNDLNIQLVGAGYALGAASGSLTSATSSTFNITPAAAAKLAFGVQPSNVVAGVAIAPAVTVLVEDSFGNTVTSSTASVTASLATDPTAATLLGTLTQAAVGGVATFSNLNLQVVGTGYALGAASMALTSTTSGLFNVTPAAASKLAFGVQPSAVVAGVAISPSVTVLVEDSFGNTVTTSTASVTANLATDPTSATLFGTLARTAVSGVVTFNDLNIQTVGTGYVLGAASTSLTSTTSSAFNVTPAAAAKLAFNIQPSNVVAGVAIAPSVTVLVEDSFGNTVTTSTASVTASLATDPTSAPLLGTLTRAAVAGVATFNDLNIQKVGTGYALGAASGSLTSATSGTFNVTPAAATMLAFSVQPTSAVAGVAIAPPVTALVQDSFGNTVTTSTASVTASLATNPTAATLFGTLTRAAVAGVATFNDLNVQVVGTGYALGAASASLTSTTSGTFNITAAGATKLAFGVQPTAVVAGVAIAPSVTVLVEDSFGNTVTTSTASIIANLATDPTSATLHGTLTRAAVGGVATFNDLSVQTVGTGYALGAAGASLTSTTSGTFNVTPAAATKLAFGVQPSAVVAGVAIAPSVTVLVQDSFGNTVTTSTASVTASLSTNPTSTTLFGTTTRAAVSGVATFNDLNIQLVGTGYVLGAASSSLTSTISSAFNVTPAGAAKLAFGVQPSNVVAGAAIAPSITVLIEDPFGNTVTSSTASVTASLSTNPSGTMLLGTTTRAAVSGVATFNDLNLHAVGTGYVLGAASGTLTAATSSTFNVTPAAAAKLAFGVQPSNTVAGVAIAPSVTVLVEDSFGNTVTTSTASVTASLATDPTSATLLGTLTRTAVAGVATFNDLNTQTTGTGYQLGAASASLTSGTSSTFNITPAAATKLVFTVQPGTTALNHSITPAVQVSIEDSFSNVTTSTASVTIALATSPAGAVLAGTLVVAAVSGVATFSNLSANTRGSTYSLLATSPSLTSATSSVFTVGIVTCTYTNPSTTGALVELVADASSTTTTVVLDLKTLSSISAYGVGMDIPLDTTKVQAGSPLMTAGTALSPGTGTVAAAAALPSSGPLAGVLVSAQSQKAAGGGAVTSNTTIPSGTILYQLQLTVLGAAVAGNVFNGTSLQTNAAFAAMVRDLEGNDTVTSAKFAIGSLDVQVN